MLTCRHCGLEKQQKEFVKHRETKSGYINTCKTCKKTRYPTSEEQKQKQWERQIKRNYGITIADYDRMFAEQNGACMGCYQPPKKQRLSVDHCHETGRVRGLLCQNCNIALGLVNDSAFILANLTKYVLSE